MGNLVYITGAPRCGKTTLADKLKNNNTSILSLDALSKSIRGVFTDFKLYEGRTLIQPNINKEKFIELVALYCSSFFNDFPNMTLIVEGCHFTPEEFKMKFPKSKIICLGRTKSLDDIKNAVMTKSWMSSLPQEEINVYAEKIYNFSLYVKENVSEYLYFETDEINISESIRYIFSYD